MRLVPARPKLDSIRFGAWLFAMVLIVPIEAITQTSTGARFRQLSQDAARAQRQGETKEAAGLYLEALQVKPEWADGWRNAGMLLADLQEFDRAHDAFRQLLRIQPKNGAGWALLGMCEYELHRYDEALQHIQHGRTLGIGNGDLDLLATYHESLLLIQKGEFLVAQKLLTRVERMGTSETDLVTPFGLAALRMAMLPDKVPAAQKDLVERVGKIEIAAIHQPVPEIVSAYKNLFTEFPQARGLHYALGNVLFNAGHYDEGLLQMDQELAQDPDDAMAHLQMAMAYEKTNQFEKALPSAEKAVRLAPDLFAAHYALGRTLYKLGQNDRAIAEFEKLIRLSPELAQGHYVLAEAYLRAGRRKDADRERALFAKLKEKEAAASATADATGSAAPRGQQSGSPH